jgi:hypothetical protein
MYDRGEVLVKDIILLPMYTVLGFINIIWFVIGYIDNEGDDSYCLYNLVNRCLKGGNIKLWRSKKSIAKEVLFGQKGDKN